jgi:hypothetical protein
LNKGKEPIGVLMPIGVADSDAVKRRVTQWLLSAHSTRRGYEDHIGKWVAIRQKRIVATGPTLEVALEEAMKVGNKPPFLYRVPEFINEFK